jgi:hypothetical protein
MSPTLYRDTGYSLTHLIGDISHGNIALPDIQRPFVWKASKVRDLFDSMYRGFPVGTLMFWETGAEVGTRQIGDAEGRRVAKLLIVDGQQRLTGLYAVIAGVEVLNDKFEYRRIRLAFRPSDETFDVADPAWVRVAVHRYRTRSRISSTIGSTGYGTSRTSASKSLNSMQRPTRNRLRRSSSASTPRA